MTDLNYDATVEFASRMAAEKGWVLLQDTTLPGYTAIPKTIMQGYTAMVDEACEQAGGPPTHVVLQARTTLKIECDRMCIRLCLGNVAAVEIVSVHSPVVLQLL